MNPEEHISDQTALKHPVADEETVSELEFAKILEFIHLLAYTDHGMELVSALRPTPDLDQANLRQAQSVQMRALLDYGVGLPFTEISDIRPQLSRLATEGSFLKAKEFQELAGVLSTAGAVRRALGKSEKLYPDLCAITASMSDHKALTGAVAKAIDEAGEVKDSASSALKEIRRDQRRFRSEIYNRLANFFTDKRTADAIGEDTVVMRNERFCIPVRVDSLSAVKGIIHGRSGSGSTAFVEPMAVVELNNRLAELSSAEEAEIRKILIALSDKARGELGELQATERGLTELDFIRARARLARRLGANPPQLSAGTAVELYKARHPLLMLYAAERGEEPTEVVVPSDFFLGGKVQAVVISGPNAGGKTVAVKTVGILAMMAQAGLEIPASADSRLPVFAGIYAEIGEGQSVEENLSTFSAHLLRLGEVISSAKKKSLVILDELGVGTDPAYGSALAIAVIDHLCGAGALTMATTHYDQLKRYAFTRENMVNAAVEFSEESGTPTYHLIWNSYGSSHSLEIAESLGFPPKLIRSARAIVGEERESLEKTIAAAEAERAKLSRERVKIADDKAFWENRRHELEKRLSDWDKEHKKLIAEARREGKEFIYQAKEEARRLLKELREGKETVSEKEVVAKLEEISRLEEKVSAEEDEEMLEEVAALSEGDWVRLKDGSSIGQVEEVDAKRGQVSVAMGGLTLRVPFSKVEPVETPPDREGSVGIDRDGEEGGSRVMLVGMRVEEALGELDRRLDEAMVMGLSSIVVVHGFGTGRLRNAVREFLRHHSQVEDFRSGGEGEGGGGVTVVELKG